MGCLHTEMRIQAVSWAAAVGLCCVGVSASGQDTRTVLLTGDEIGGLPAVGATYSEFTTPQINDAGTLLYRGRVAGATAGEDTGLWTIAADGTQRSIAFENGISPSGGGGIFTRVNYNDFFMSGGATFNNQGDVLFSSGLDGTFVNATNDEGVFFARSTGAVSEVIRLGDQAAGLPSGVVYGDSVGLSPASFLLNESGQFAFSAEFSGTGVPANTRGIWQGDVDGVDLVTFEGAQAPGAPLGVQLSTIGLSTQLLSGELIIGTQSLLPDFSTENAVISAADGNLERVLGDNDVAVGSATFDNFLGIPNRVGGVAVQTRLSDPGGVLDGREALFSGSPTALRQVAIDGVDLPGLGTAIDFFAVRFNDLGQTAYNAAFADPTGSPLGVALFLDDGESADLIAAEGVPAPGVGAGVFFSTAVGSPGAVFEVLRYSAIQGRLHLPQGFRGSASI